ncbi:hypothetical protein M427DRAFT_152170 [Gonapodya prolifera JEL478]|uniref:TATA element modulatory factor 1 TATA binding domain-containing protein n=1 Tax=Gonapodya prolifera (strain JEL478) TaxID=1344416 RepID=A0A139AUD8_GONPJ|nr:hypothetical protein M427DRAFT_152170 [Gonapodya prolifera JEL478]|eukprot:KXS20319.1 hypothetical protein M427DRAFT_152170 [Gonapodya prolifera JEL478]
MEAIVGNENVPPKAPLTKTKPLSGDSNGDASNNRAAKLLEYLQSKKVRGSTDPDRKKPERHWNPSTRPSATYAPIAQRVPLGDTTNPNTSRNSLGSNSGGDSGNSKRSPEKRVPGRTPTPTGFGSTRPPTPTGITVGRPPTPPARDLSTRPSHAGTNPSTTLRVFPQISTSASDRTSTSLGQTEPRPVPQSRATERPTTTAPSPTSPRSPSAKTRTVPSVLPDRRRQTSLTRASSLTGTHGKTTQISARPLSTGGLNFHPPAISTSNPSTVTVALTSAQLKRPFNVFDDARTSREDRDNTENPAMSSGEATSTMGPITTNLAGPELDVKKRRSSVEVEKKHSSDRRAAVSHKATSRPRTSPPRPTPHPYKLSPRRRLPSASPPSSRSRPITKPALIAESKPDRLAFTLDQVFAASSLGPPAGDRASSPPSSDPESLLALEELTTGSPDNSTQASDLNGLLTKHDWGASLERISKLNLPTFDNRNTQPTTRPDDSLSARIAELERLVVTKESQYAALAEQKQCAEAVASERSQRIDQLTSELTAAQQSADFIRKQLDESAGVMKEIERFKVALKDAERECQRLRIALNEAERDLERTKEALRVTLKEVAKSKEDAEKARAEIVEQRERVGEAERAAKAKTDAVLGDLSRLEREAELAVKAKADTDRRYQSALSELEAVARDREAVKKELGELKSRHQLVVRDYSVKIRDLERQRIGEVTQVRTEAEAAAKVEWEGRLSAQDQRRSEEVALLRVERDAARLDMEQATKEIEEAHELITQLADRQHWIEPTEYQRVCEERRQAQEEARNLRRSMNELDEKLELSEAKAFREETNRLIAEEKTKRAEEKLVELVDEMAGVMRECDELTAQVRSRGSENQALIADLSTLRERLIEAEAQLSRSETRDASTTTDVAFDLKTYQEAENAVSTVRTLLLGNATMYQRMHQNHDAYMAVVDDLTGQLAELERTRDELVTENEALTEKLRQATSNDTTGGRAKASRNSRA